MKLIFRQCVFSLLLVFIFLSNTNAQFEITPDKSDGVYKSGETVTWTVRSISDKEYDSLRYSIKPGGLHVVDSGFLTLVDNMAHLNYSFDAPGTVLLTINWGKEDNYINKSVGGAVADPNQIKLSSPKPDDFDSFWEEKLSELASVPLNARLAKGECKEQGVDYYEITMDNIRGSHIHGQLARPTDGEKFPALLIVQWAGVYPLHKDWAINRAKEGWLVLNIIAHDIPIHNDENFYREQANGNLKNYPAIGNDNKETSYFLRMYLSCYRAAAYLSQRSDWNGETIVVTGGSQGGQQALMTAGFYPGITACLSLVPAGFDMLGPGVGRKGGWPQWYYSTNGKDPEKVHEASRYFDVANFVPSIKCPVLVGVGLLDETCPPGGILAGLNQLKGPNEIIILPKGGHQDVKGSHQPYKIRMEETWLPALKAGKGMPD